MTTFHELRQEMYVGTSKGSFHTSVPPQAPPGSLHQPEQCEKSTNTAQPLHSWLNNLRFEEALELPFAFQSPQRWAGHGGTSKSL